MEQATYPSQPLGFSLVELMISLAIIGIIAAIAIPSYNNYTRRAYYSEIVKATAPFKIGVAECYYANGSFTGCNGGAKGIPNNISSGKGMVATVTTTNGNIAVVPNSKNGITTTDTYTLKPIYENGAINWSASGGGVNHGYANAG